MKYLRASTTFVSLVCAKAILEGSAPIWHPNNRSVETYIYFRSPQFTLPLDASQLSSAFLTITAQQSPNIAGAGTTQSKLLGAYKLAVNGLYVTAGPGHSVPQSMQAVNSLDLLPLLRNTPNVITVASYFNNVWKTRQSPDMPKVQAVLSATSSDGTRNWTLTATGPSWVAYDATGYHTPDGDNGNGDWYHLPNEDLTAPARVPLVGWESPSYVPNSALGWTAAAVTNTFPIPFYIEPAAPPAMLWRSPCSITELVSAGDTCGVAAESESLVLSCTGPGGPGGVISAVTFASYGTPSGQCLPNGSNNFATNASCNSPQSAAVLSSLCVGQPSCTVVPSNNLFGGDPCHLTPKHLSAAVTCTGGGSNSTPSYHYVVDFGQEFLGGLNISWPGPIVSSANAVIVKLGEELFPANATGKAGTVMVPSRAGENYTSRWTLVPTSSPSGDAANQAMFAHEFIQFRYAEIIGSPVQLSQANLRAWVVQHPFEGTGENPYEIPCAVSTPNVPPPSARPVATYGQFSSSSPGLDAVFNLTAYTAVSTTLDINVDSQTRQRDLCHIDALITGHEQYAVFPVGDYAIQKRTFRDAFANDSAAWPQWTEFKQSTAIMSWLDAFETGDLSIARDMWSTNDMSINSDAHPSDYLSLQFMAGVRYYNGSGSGLLHYPADCGGAWHCDPLVDWPTNTRDGYVINATGNQEDAVRNGLGAVAISALSDLAALLGYAEAGQRYSAMVQTIQQGLLRYMLRFDSYNGQPEAFFTDGVTQSHAAVHSTIYGVISGAPAGNATLSSLLAAYLIRRDVVPSSCMTGRWYVQAMYDLGIQEPAAADYALWLLSRDTYPSWGYMLTRGATTTLEAWAPEDKWNTDWAHPWCAAPAFLIPRWLMGVQPTAPGWVTFQVRPQPGNLTNAQARVPTPLGPILAVFTQGPAAQGAVSIQLAIPAGSSAQVCLPPLHPSFQAFGLPRAQTKREDTGGQFTTGGDRQAKELALARDSAGQKSHIGGSVDTLLVDGAVVPSVALGRLLCTVPGHAVTSGDHTVVRKAA